MIKVRLIKLLSHAKKYVVLQVLWQWIALIAQVLLIFTLSGMIAGCFNAVVEHVETTTPAFGICLPVFGTGAFFLFYTAFTKNLINFSSLVTGTVAMLGSFGPVVALSNLSNNLNQTIASGNRVLNLLEEKPVVEEVTSGCDINFAGASVENVTFAYDEKQILKDFNAVFQKGKITGIHGASGCGKSTLLKLLMRFWDVDRGQIKISGENVKNLNTENLRSMISYITQETYIFNGSIAENISLGAECFTQAEIESAAKKASLHDFIMSLPHGYSTKTGELGSSMSGGERQRIGLARAFLYDAKFMLLDEPTSNLDSLNEAVILKSLKDEKDKDPDKTMVLVSHRKSTLAQVDKIINFHYKPHAPLTRPFGGGVT